MKYVSILFVISLALLASFIALAQENAGNATTISVPLENLPGGFNFLAMKNASTPGVNITDEIIDFYGNEDIGPANATIGIYTWAPIGERYDAKITLLSLQDEMQAEAAISNYKSLPEFKNPPYRGIDRFSTVNINGHEATEIRDATGNQDLRFLYLWNNDSVVVLVEGNGDRNDSMNLASATGL
jgi:hypothetical protein